MKKMTTQHSGGVPGEKRWVPVGTQLAEHSSGMCESRDSRSSIRIEPARNIPLRTTNKPRLRNGYTLPQLFGRTAFHYFQSRIRLRRRKSCPLWIPVLKTQVAVH